MTTAIKPETAPYLDAFRNHEGNANEPNWLVDRRAAALKQFAALGFPTRRDEPWRFTNLTPLARAAFPPAPPPKVAEHRLQLEPYLIGGPAHRIVLIDGYFVPELSPIGRLPKGVYDGYEIPQRIANHQGVPAGVPGEKLLQLFACNVRASAGSVR